MKDFAGSKIALYYDNQIIVYLRDDKPGLNFAGMWDLPGGGRENKETPFQCVQREVIEEFGMHLDPAAISWTREYPALVDPNRRMHFFVGEITKEQVDSIVFGEEGQEWRFMKPEEFIAHENAIPGLRGSLRDYLAR
jgi:8-oxo-dGTP diphosphatase